MKKILILLTAVSIFQFACKADKEEKKIFEDTELIAVKTAPVNSLKLPGIVQVTGLVGTENETRYGFKVGGVISRVFVEEGQFFKKGQLLATLNTTEIAAGVSQSSLSVEKALRDYNRAKNLYQDSVYTLEQLENSKTALNLAEKGKEAVAFNERYSRIYATSDGFVQEKIASAGEVINAGAPVLLINETKKNNNYVLKAGLNDKEWAAVDLGQKASVKLDGYPDKQFESYVFRKSQTADQRIGSFQVELKLDLKDTKPAVGMFGKASIMTGRDEQAISIPYDALIEADGDKGFVFIVNGSDKVKKTPVNILRFDNQSVYLLAGLKETEKVVISNSAYLNEQSTIKIIP